MNIVLIGFMCSGKSKVGRLLAQRLGRPHYDTDELISRKTNMSVADLIRTQGEQAFRDHESEAVREVSSLQNAVISTGGGAPLREENMQTLSKSGYVVWLKVSPEVILKRAGNLASRPLIDPDHPLDSIRRRLAEREQAYAAAAYSVDTDAMNPHDVAEKVLSTLPKGF